MAGAYLYGFRVDTGAKVKILCTAEGKLLIDPALILEDDPTENESKKAPTSKWAFAHKADAGAHHTKFTAAEARAAINDILNAGGNLTAGLNARYNPIVNVGYISFRESLDPTVRGYFDYQSGTADFRMRGYKDGVGNTSIDVLVYNGTDYEILATQVYVDSKVAIVKGTHYWSCPGNAFLARYPDVDDVCRATTGLLIINADTIYCVCPVNLPNGATVTGVIVYGNAAAEAETWSLVRIKLSDATTIEMAAALIETEDISILVSVIDNSLYAYYFYTSSLDTDDEIRGARITYTL